MSLSSTDHSGWSGGVQMNAQDSHSSLKHKALHEFKEITIVFLYLAVFFCALSTYSGLLLEKYEVSYFGYGAALLNAFVITKVILIGEAAHLGRELESKPVIYSGIYKASVYGLLVFAFHIVEEIVKRLIHGKDIAGVFHEMRLQDLLARSVIIFLTFIPFFGFRELGRILGKDKFRALVFGTGAAKSNPSPTI
jgi:hypothetical protein